MRSGEQWSLFLPVFLSMQDAYETRLAPLLPTLFEAQGC